MNYHEATRRPDVSGRMFLYERPELLTLEEHGSLGLRAPSERTFDFAKSATAVPLTMIEFSSAQKHYPIVFSGREQPVPLAIVGLSDQVNLFVDSAGKWDPHCYVPTYLRCHPFAFATEEGGSRVVVIDRAADAVSAESEFPFFIDGEPSAHTNRLIELCAMYEAERRRTETFCARLVELSLLAVQEAFLTGAPGSEKQVLANYICIDADKLTGLDRDVVYELHQDGQLSAMYLHHYSLQNWRDLTQRRAARPADSD